MEQLLAEGSRKFLEAHGEVDEVRRDLLYLSLSLLIWHIYNPHFLAFYRIDSNSGRYRCMPARCARAVMLQGRNLR